MKNKFVFILIISLVYSILALIIFPVSFAGIYMWVLIDKLTGGALFEILHVFQTGNPIITGLVMIAINNFFIGCLIGWGIYKLEMRRKANLQSKHLP